MFSAYNIISLGAGALLGIGIPTAAAIIFKVKNKNVWLPSVFTGAAVFLVFAMILEQLLHSVMRPIIGDNVAFYCIYGALAAGIFEETGRLAAYKTVMRKHLSTDNALYMGIGHGGFEAIMILGLNMLVYFIMALAFDSRENTELLAAQNSVSAELMTAQLEVIARVGIPDILLSVFERLIAMTFHVCMSVWMYKSVSQKGKFWLYPAAVIAHALLDLSAVLYQTGVLTSIAAVYITMTAVTGIIVFVTVKMVKKTVVLN